MSEYSFTVITVCRNSQNTIRDTFESVLNQINIDNTSLEYIVIDGNSSDGTVAIIKEYENKFLEKGVAFTWISEPDHGIYDAMNKGINKAQGAYIGILNSDDTYCNSTLHFVQSEIERGSNADVYHGIMRYYNGSSLSMIHASNSEHLNKGMIEHPTCFVKADVYKKYGMFDLQYRYVADYDFMIRLKHNNCKFVIIEEILANYNENGAGNSYESRRELLKLKRRYRLESRPTLIMMGVKYWLRELREHRSACR